MQTAERYAEQRDTMKVKVVEREQGGSLSGGDRESECGEIRLPMRHLVSLTVSRGVLCVECLHGGRWRVVTRVSDSVW